MKLLLPAIGLFIAASVAPPAGAGEVKLQLANGRMTLQAHDASIRDILAEYSRVGGVKIVNGEKVTGGPVTLELQNVTEAQALNILLRSVSGYMASPREEEDPSASTYDRIFVMSQPRPASTSGTSVSQPEPQIRRFPGRPNPGIFDDQTDPNELDPQSPAFQGRMMMPGQVSIQMPAQGDPGNAAGPAGSMATPTGLTTMPTAAAPATGPAGTVTAPPKAQPTKPGGGRGGRG
jgi:hypothetical protein